MVVDKAVRKVKKDVGNVLGVISIFAEILGKVEGETQWRGGTVGET